VYKGLVLAIPAVLKGIYTLNNTSKPRDPVKDSLGFGLIRVSKHRL
jgi:hypothetical protein